MQEFVRAVIAYEKKLSSSSCVAKPLKLNQEMEKKRTIISQSGDRSQSGHETEVEIGAKYLEANIALSLQQEKRLKQKGATVRNASSYMRRLRMNEEKERIARVVMEKMPVGKLWELMSFHTIMSQICSEAMERELQDLIIEKEVEL
ncbi:hypothetical protein SLE2022_218380 [Rubroshorea leprosula]